MSTLTIRDGSLAELYAYRIDDDGTEHLLAVYANDESGRARLHTLIDEHFELDMETCSWCLTEVPDSTLTDMKDGQRICALCLKDADPTQVDGYDPDEEG